MLIECRNVNDGFYRGMDLLAELGVEEASRYGDVLVMLSPVMVRFAEPRERVLFEPVRDANPFFHFMEGLWMLNGQRDVATLKRYNSRIDQFSDDKQTLHGAYGWRWRNHFCTDADESYDQLTAVIDELKKNPLSRRVVLQMWDPVADLCRDGVDLPCNVCVMFRTRADTTGEERKRLLDMTVCNRSNDIVWGLFGANAVHMSMLHEVVAACAGLQVGVYTQFTNNFHGYDATFKPLHERLNYDKTINPYIPYKSGRWQSQPGAPVQPYSMVVDPRTWFNDLHTFMHNLPGGFRTMYANPFFYEVAEPVHNAWMLWKRDDVDRGKRITDAVQHLQVHCRAQDWRMACVEWLQRRMKQPERSDKP
jgi:thymidylate synthase